jgi:4-amino-4-deoxy-L-arabinose transferase-like glycosyltransferase
MTSTPRPWCRPGWWLLAGLAAFTAMRLAQIPKGGMDYHGFSHDSGYIVIIARNLLAGRGYVNDAHWLVFLNPEQLPVPYHNANPLYPTAVAGVAALTGGDTVWAGFAVSVLAGSMLAAALYVAAGRFETATWRRVLLAAAGVFFPTVFEATQPILPDALCAALLACFVAALVWGGWKNDLAAGAALGLAWLARSTAMLAVPAAVVFLVLEDGWRGAGRRGARLAGAALAITLPWLIHTAVVWGNPLRSDASYYLWQSYHARHRPDGNVVKYWRSPEPPPSMGEVLRQEPGELAAYYWSCLRRMPLAVRDGWLAGWQEVGGVKPVNPSWVARLLEVLVVGAVVLAVARRKGQRLWTPARVAGLVYAATCLVVLAPRAATLEMRYLTPLSVVVALFLMSGTLAAADVAWRGRGLARLAACALLLPAALFWLGYVPFCNFHMVRRPFTHGDWQAAHLQSCRNADAQYLHGRPVVVGDFPYYYTAATGRPSLGMPSADEAYLVRYMDRYGVRHVYLRDDEVEFWRPEWRHGLTNPRFRVVGRVDGGTVYELVDSP